jgi:hypothetical protein
MSYSRTVRVLSEIVDAGAVDAVFFPEEDRLRLALLNARDQRSTARPGLIGESREDQETLDDPPTDAELAAQAESADRESESIRDRIIRFANPGASDDDR